MPSTLEYPTDALDPSSEPLHVQGQPQLVDHMKLYAASLVRVCRPEPQHIGSASVRCSTTLTISMSLVYVCRSMVVYVSGRGEYRFRGKAARELGERPPHRKACDDDALHAIRTSSTTRVAPETPHNASANHLERFSEFVEYMYLSWARIASIRRPYPS